MDQQTTDLNQLAAKHRLLLVKFEAEWCEPCKWAEPVIDSVIIHYKGALVLQKTDIDRQPDIARENHVLSVPTLVLFKDGREVWRMRGYDVASVLIRALDVFVDEGMRN